MGLFSQMSEPVILKEDSSAKEQLEQLQALLPRVPAKVKTQLERDIKILQYGIEGENRILFELKNSHLPMFVLHDLLLEDGEQTAQIDFYLVTPKVNFIIECKNLYGDIEITGDGSFIRTLSYGGKEVKEGIYSPVTQNERHMELIRKRRGQDLGAIRRAMYDKVFYRFNRSLIVLANPKTVLNDHNAPKEIREQVVRADQLIRTLKAVNDRSKEMASSPKDMEGMARSMLSFHKEAQKDYTEKYLQAARAAEPAPARRWPKPSPASRAAAPKPPAAPTAKPSGAGPDKSVSAVCPKCNGKLVRKHGKYGWFWACSNYPECKFTRN